MELVGCKVCICLALQETAKHISTATVILHSDQQYLRDSVAPYPVNTWYCQSFILAIQWVRSDMLFWSYFAGL